MVRILGMASNRGRNLRNIADERPGGASLAAIVSNHEDAPVLEAAAERDIPAFAVERRAEEDRFEHERRILDAVSEIEVDLVCLDGYMRILSSTFLEAMPLTLNIHPSLLPGFPGTDAWGAAIDAGVRVTGCTVHVVTDAIDENGEVIGDLVDGGPILTQEPIPVYETDTTETLKSRVLTEGEFVAYPRAVEWVANGVVDRDEDGSITVATDTAEQFPHRRLTTQDLVGELRYGENPHQAAAVYRDWRNDQPSVVGAEAMNPDAKALSYNNYNDADAALGIVREFDAPAAAVIKHTNPAGCATASSVATAYKRALATDPKSAFGGVVALNRECDEATATQIVESFKEVVIAPSYTSAAVATLQERESLRVLAVGELESSTTTPIHEKDLTGGRLVQEADTQQITPEDLEVVTDREPTTEEIESLCFAWQVAKHVKSNAIVFAKGTETVGIGAGQVSRVDAVRLAGMKASADAEGKDAEGAVMASDAFFPFPDGVEVAAEAGIEAVVQPGGSKRDDAVIDAANELGMTMVLTGQRCFRHD